MLAIRQELAAPILFIGTGEGMGDLAPFDAGGFVDVLLAPGVGGLRFFNDIFPLPTT